MKLCIIETSPNTSNTPNTHSNTSNDRRKHIEWSLQHGYEYIECECDTSNSGDNSGNSYSGNSKDSYYSIAGKLYMYIVYI